MTGKSNVSAESRARDIVGWYTLGAGATGAVPVPATSAAIVANNGFMLAHISTAMGKSVAWDDVLKSLGVAGTLNIAGRAVFVEAAKALGWGTGSVWALAVLSAIGATTAALQTYVIGLIAIEICKNGGAPIGPGDAAKVVEAAKESLGNFTAEMKSKDLKSPDATEQATTTNRIIQAVLARSDRNANRLAAPPHVVRHPSGEERWAIRAEWIDDVVAEYELVGQPMETETDAQLATRLEEAVWQPFPTAQAWGTRTA
jgi:hypothetical protein